MHKFFVEPSEIIEGIVTIEGEDVKHIYKVLRLKVGDVVNINDCNGTEYNAKLTSIDKKEVKAEIIETLDNNNESPIKIVLYQGMPKATKMDYIVQKGTEVGINAFIPVNTERVVVNTSEFKKLDRLNRIAKEAAKQSKRTIIPKVYEPVEFNDLLKKLVDYDLIVVPYENAENFGIKNLAKNLNNVNRANSEEINSVAIIIGPEGGFEDSEIESLKEINAHIVTLGPRILRTETAGVVCASLVMYEFGDMGGDVQ